MLNLSDYYYKVYTYQLHVPSALLERCPDSIACSATPSRFRVRIRLSLLTQCVWLLCSIISLISDLMRTFEGPKKKKKGWLYGRL